MSDARSEGVDQSGKHAGHQFEVQVTDKQLRNAIRAAESRAVNGLPDTQSINEEIPLSIQQTSKRLRQLADDDTVTLHDSVIRGGTSGVTTTVELHKNPDGGDGS